MKIDYASNLTLALMLIFGFWSCQSDEDWQTVSVQSETAIALPSDAVFGQVSSFEGLQAVLPDLIWFERVDSIGLNLERILFLSDSTFLRERLVQIDNAQLSIHVDILESSLPIQEGQHVISVESIEGNGGCTLKWMTGFRTQVKNKEVIKTKFEGLQEAYLYTLEMLGLEMEELLKDESF